MDDGAARISLESHSDQDILFVEDAASRLISRTPDSCVVTSRTAREFCFHLRFARKQKKL